MGVGGVLVYNVHVGDGVCGGQVDVKHTCTCMIIHVVMGAWGMVSVRGGGVKCGGGGCEVWGEVGIGCGG